MRRADSGAPNGGAEGVCCRRSEDEEQFLEVSGLHVVRRDSAVAAGSSRRTLRVRGGCWDWPIGGFPPYGTYADATLYLKSGPK